MSAEIIRVDFRDGRIVGRMKPDSQEPKEPWVAAKDPAFKSYIAGIAAFAEEMVNGEGADWSRMLCVIHDPNIGNTESDGICATLFDTSVLNDEEAELSLAIAILRMKEASQRDLEVPE